jgi:hypothetical protein
VDVDGLDGEPPVCHGDVGQLADSGAFTTGGSGCTGNSEGKANCDTPA